MELIPARSVVATLLAAAVSLLAAASAAAFSIDSVDVGVAPGSGPLPPSGPTAAGAHPDQSTTIAFRDPAFDSVASLQLHLAPGVVAFINNVPVCESWDAASEDETTCPESVVGSTATSVTASVAVRLPPPLDSVPIGAELPLTLSGTIYRIPSPRPATVPAAFGIDIAPPLPILRRVKLVSPITVDPHDLGLRASLDGLPDEASGLPIRIDAITQTLFGYTAGGRSFFTNPTACFPAPVAVTATSHGGATASGSGSYTPTDCAGVPFDTTLAVEANPATADSTSAVSFDVRPGSADVPRANAHVRTTTVVAPPGMLLNPALAARLDACTDAQFAQADTSVPATCPPSSAVGEILFVSPILGPFRGAAYFGTQTPTDRLRLFLDVPLFGAHIKVSATVNPDYGTGQITTVFSQLPQIAFTSFRLTFRGGAQSALVTPTTCGVNTATAIVAPWSGGPPSTPSGSFTTTDCARVFAPSLSASVSNPQAGASTAFTLNVERPDRQVPIGRMDISLPAGLIGKLSLDGLAKCSLADAAASRCPAASRIGSVTSVVGSGGEPPSLPGAVYLTEPKVAGDPAGLSVNVPARLGPVEAGTVIVGTRLVLRGDGGLDVLSDPIPSLQLGIPLAIRRLTVTIDRDGFMRNPTSCGSKAIAGAFAPIDGGPGATATAGIDIGGCERLTFRPRMSARIGARGKTRVRSHPPFTTVIRQGADQAALRLVRVRLPRALSTSLRALNAACEQADLDAGRCSRRARTATATATSPLISSALRGPVWLVKQPRGLPKLVVQLRGEVSLDLEGLVSIGRGNTVVTTFGAIPDLSVSRFELRFRGGPWGVLEAVKPLCRARGRRALRLGTRMTPQSGRSVTGKRKITVAGCGGRGSRAKRGGGKRRAPARR